MTVRLDGDVARFTARYIVHTESSNESGISITQFLLPERGLVTTASVIEGGRRHVLELVDATQASEDFNKIFEKPTGRAPRSAVLLTAGSRDPHFGIEVAMPKSATLQLDVEIAAPTCFHSDARYVVVPLGWKPRLPEQPKAPQVAIDACLPNGLGEQHVLRFAARELAVKPGGAERVGAYAGRVALGRTHVVRLEMDLAGKLSEIPQDLATAIVVDASRSMSTAEQDAQREAIAAYVRAAPHGRVQVIEYARFAKALLPSWMTASQAAPRIDRELRAMQRKNGSNIAEGLREAGKWLDQVKGTRRIVLFTDENLSIRDEHTRAVDDAVPANTLVHVVALGGEGLSRDDEAKLARIAARTHGISMRGGDVPQDGKLDATELVRPIRLDHVNVRTPGWKRIETERSCPDPDDEFASHSLDEGSACTWWGRADAVASPFTIEGFLWNERIVRVVRADLDRSREVARELSTMFVLEEDLQKLAERAARAVNEVWSLYASWGGDDGYEQGFGFGTSGWGSSCCCGGSSDFGHGFGSGMFAQPDLATSLTKIVAACKSTYSADVDVETTFEEIVDVEVKSASQDAKTCIENALWSAWLVAPGAPSRTITRFQLAAQ